MEKKLRALEERILVMEAFLQEMRRLQPVMIEMKVRELLGKGGGNEY